MPRKVNIVGSQAERIRDIGPTLPRIDAAEIAAGLGAEIIVEAASDLDPISLAALGSNRCARKSRRGTTP